MASRLAIGVSVGTAALVAATFTGATSLAQPSNQANLALTAATNQQIQVASVPSEAEVNSAKVDPAAKKTMAERLQRELDTTSSAVEKIAERAQNSWDALTEAQQKAIKRQELANTATTQSAAAQKRLAESQKQVGQIASESYRNGGMNPSVGELLTGDAQKALDRSQTLKNLAESRTRNLKSSESDAALASAWAKYTEAAKRESDRAVKAQTDAEANAQKEATGYRTEVQAQDSARKQLITRLAALNGTTFKQEEAALTKRENVKREQALKAAMKAEAAKKAEEEQAARKAAAEKAAAEAKDDSAEGLPRPANVPGTEDSSADGQEEGSSAGSKTQAQKDAEAKEAAEKAAEKAEQDKANKAAAAAKAAQEKADKEADAKADAQAKADAEAKKKAQEAKDAREKAEQEQSGDNDSKDSAEEKAAEQKREQAKADAAAKAAKEKAAAQKRAAAAAAEKKSEQRKAAQKAASQAKAKKAAAAKKAQARAAAKKAAKKAAAKRAAERAAAKKRAERADSDNNNGGSSSSKEAAIDWAMNIGANNYYGYIFGANGPRYFDCSSFALTAFKKSGISMTRTSTSQFKNAPKRIPLSQLKRGDLVFSSSNGGASMYHVAIYMGNGQVVHARNPNAGISPTPLSWVNNLYPLAARY